MNRFFTYPPLLVAVAAVAGCSGHTPYHGPPLQLMEIGRADFEPVDDQTEAPGPAPEIEADLGELPPLRSIAGHLESQRVTDQAVAQPQDAERVRSVINYRYHPGTVYQVDTQPGFLTALVLEPGERVISRAAGDTERWLVEETAVGSGPSHQVTVIIKPTTAPLVTNLLITTDRRMYQIEMLANHGPDAAYQSLIAWRYARIAITPGMSPPPEGADGLLGDERSSNSGGGGDALALASDLSRLDFDYKIMPVKSRQVPRWTPQQVFNDGAKTYIKFPIHALQLEAPPLFLRVGEEDQLVNYRVIGDTYVVDRVFDTAVLKVGKDKADQVVIEYVGSFFGDK